MQKCYNNSIIFTTKEKDKEVRSIEYVLHFTGKPKRYLYVEGTLEFSGHELYNFSVLIIHELLVLVHRETLCSLWIE